MTLDKILDRMDDLLSESVSLPLSNRKLVDVEKMQDLLDELRRNLPQEIKDAKGVVLDRDSIIEQAENQAEDIIQKAEVRARQMTGTEYLMIDCDGKLWESDIREDVLPFVMAYYYVESGEYLAHYTECCLDHDDKPCYGVITDEEGYARLKAKMDEAYDRFVLKR